MIRHAFFIVLGVLAIYLTGGFMVLEFNVVEWSIAGRTVFACICWFYVFSYIHFAGRDHGTR